MPGPSHIALLMPLLYASASAPANANASTPDTAQESPPSRSRRFPSDDLTLEDLNAVLQQQAETIQSFHGQFAGVNAHMQTLEISVNSLRQQVVDLTSDNSYLKAQVTSLTDRLNASSKAVGFSARMSHDGGQMSGVALGDQSTLIFDAVLDNVGGAYDPHTGIFTAPVPGLYAFFLTQMTADNKPYLWLSILRDGEQTLDRIYTEGGQGGSGDTHDQGATQVVTHLQAGQKVWVRHDSGGAVRGGWFSLFTGYLLQAD